MHCITSGQTMLLLQFMQLVGRNGFEAREALDMLRTEHPLVVMPNSMQLSGVPQCEIVHLCSQDRHDLTGGNFPEVYDDS